MTEAVRYFTLVHELAALTVEIKEAVESESWDELLALLENRQALMGRIDALPEEAKAMTEEERLQAVALLQAITEADHAGRAAIDAAMAIIRPELQAGQTARKGISAYQRSNRVHPDLVPSRFVDKQR